MADDTGRARRFARGIKAAWHGYIWLILMVAILGYSAYSLYWIAREWGVPPYVAVGTFAILDGVALFVSGKSVAYAEAGMSGARSRFWVRLFVIASTFIQGYHARLLHEPAGAVVLYSLPPISAWVVLDEETRWARHKAFKKAGTAFPKPMPHWGFLAWTLWPKTAFTNLRFIVGDRMESLRVVAAKVSEEFRREAAQLRIVRERPEPQEEPAAAGQSTRPVTKIDEYRHGAASSGKRKRPKDLMRTRWRAGTY